MQKNIVNEVKQWLPDIDACQVELLNNSIEEKHQQKLEQIKEKIYTWARTVLEDAKLPSTAQEAKSIIHKYDASSDEGCALNVLIELESMQTSIQNKDSNTTAITSMKLFDALWNHAIAIHQQPEQENLEGDDNRDSEDNLLAAYHDDEENIKHYQKTINELSKKYPHCNINALRLLASTRLNVTKQQLDDLEITPQ